MKFALTLCAALLASPFAVANEGTNYPDRPIRIVVPFAAGGAADTITRKIAEKLTVRLKQPVVVENRAGGNTLIGSETVTKAPRDGYTLYSTNTTIVQIPMVYPNAAYNEERDFTPIAQCCSAPLALVVRSETPVKTVKEFVDYMRERPGKNAYGTAGSGGTQHILSEAFRRAMGIDAIHAPYKGEAPLVADFLGGRLDWYIATPITILPHVQSGKVRVLAVTGDDRIGLFPEAPTFREAGVPQMNAVGWYGVFAPANTPAPVVDRLSKEIVAIVKQPDIVEYLVKNGLVQTGYDAGEFAKRLPAFRQTFRSMIRENNIKVD